MPSPVSAGGGLGRRAGVIDNVSSDITVTNTASETTIYSYTVPGGTLGTGNHLRLHILGKITSLLSPPTITFKVKFGSDSFTFISAAAILASLTDEPFELCVLLCADGATNAQYVNARLIQDASVGLIGGSNPIRMKSAAFSVQSTVDRALEVTVQFGSVVADTSLTREYAYLEGLN